MVKRNSFDFGNWTICIEEDIIYQTPIYELTFLRKSDKVSISIKDWMPHVFYVSNGKFIGVLEIS